jgi:hypothetical protein
VLKLEERLPGRHRFLRSREKKNGVVASKSIFFLQKHRAYLFEGPSPVYSVRRSLQLFRLKEGETLELVHKSTLTSSNPSNLKFAKRNLKRSSATSSSEVISNIKFAQQQELKEGEILPTSSSRSGT